MTVLTAAHCLDPSNTEYLVGSAQDNPGAFSLPPVLSSPSEEVSASAAVPDPGFDFAELDKGIVPAFDDVGIIQLSAALTGASWLPLVQPDQVGPFVTASETPDGFSGLAAGYGLTLPQGNSAGNLYQTEISEAYIDTWTPGGDPADDTGALIDYQNPQASEDGTCEGDSGGPLLVPIGGGALPVTANPSPSNGLWAVIGDTHAGPSNECNDGEYTNVAYDGAGSATNDVAAWLQQFETPFDYTPPSVSGAPIVGNQLTCEPGTWAEPTASFAYTWETAGSATPISGADGPTYTPKSTDAGSQLECSVTATVTSFGSTNSATSGPVAVTTVGINTSQLPGSVTVGGSVADQATMLGGDNPTGTVTFDLYNNPNGTGTPLFTDTETLSGGTATSASYTTTAAGTDYWVVTYNGDANNSSVSSYAAEPVTISPASPSINTSQQPASVTLGGSIADQATVSGGYDPTGTVTFNLYYYTSLGVRKLLFSDPNEPLVNGVATSAGLTTTLKDVGTDYWVATYNGDANNSSVSSGDTAEPVVVSSLPSPSINTSQLPASVTVGGSVADRAIVSGGDSPTGTVTFNLYNNATASGTPLFTDTETLSGGTATSASYTTTAPGTDYWVATYNGDTNNNTVTSGSALEPVIVSPASPSINTSQQPAAATVGGSVADQATVSGGDNPTGTVTFNLYNNATASGTPLFSNTEKLSNGTATSASYTTTAPGTDYWVATYNGDTNNNTLTSGSALEPVIVSPASPSISTSQQPAATTVGSSIADQATVSGGYSPTGTVTFNLYNNATASGTPLFADTESLVSGSATSKGYTVTAAGTDYWVATYNGDTNNNAVTSGSALEPVTITRVAPLISTSQQPAATTVGGSVADQATISGGYNPTGTVTFDLYNNANGTGTPLFTDTEPLSGGVATSKGYKTTATGTDYWVATYNGDANNRSVSSSTSGEPVTITTASKLADLSITISGPSSAADGSSFSEQVTVKNAGPANASNVLTTVLVPNGTTVTSTGGGTLVFGAVYWTASQINTGAKVTYTVTFEVSAHASGNVLIPAATASLANPDPNYTNNATATTVTLGGKTTATTVRAHHLRNPLAVGKRLPALLTQLTHRHRAKHHNS